MRQPWSIQTACIALLVALTACGGDDPVVDPEPDEAIAPFVGTWDADVFTVTSDADPTIVADLIDAGGSFTINVQPSGTYTATLVFSNGDTSVPLVEIGQLSVTDDYITLRPTGGDPATSDYTFLSDDHLRLEGPTDFDFNGDGELDPAQAFIELWLR